MKVFCRLYLSLAYYFAVSVFIVVSFLVNVLCFVLGLIPRSNVLMRPLRRVLQFMFRRWAWFMSFIRVLDLKTPEKLPLKSSSGEIWVMNHPSLLDGSYMLKYITNGTCIYKSQIGSNPLYGSTAKLANYIPNIGGADMVRLACDALVKGEDLVVFPEGTRSTKVEVENFKSGFALIAKRSRAPINVMWMESPDDFMTREAPFWKVPELTAKVTIDRIARVDPVELGSVSAIMNEVKSSYRERAEACR